MCRLMPFWGRVFDEAKWSVRALLPIRSPLEVGWSLNRRDGLSPAYGCLLWLRHVLDAEVETRGMARAVLDWPQFLGSGRKLLSRPTSNWAWSGRTGVRAPSLTSINSFRPSLRHQRASEDDLGTHPAINDLVRRTYAAMMELVRDPGDSRALRTLDDLRAGFETASAIFDCPMREAKDEVRKVRSQAAAEIARARRHMDCPAADRSRDGGRDTMRSSSRFFWNPRSKTSAARLAASKDLETIRNSPFFNSAHYLETNPDVHATGNGPCVPLPRSWRPGRPRSRAIFLDQSLSRPIPRCRRNRRQRPPALRNTGAPRKQSRNDSSARRRSDRSRGSGHRRHR